MVEVFKTNVETREQAVVLLKMLSENVPGHRLNFDLDDCDRILRAEGTTIASEKIIELLTTWQFACEILI